MSAQAMAAPAEFNGYMRSGVMHGKSTYGHKAYVQQLGRFGNENDTFGEMQISADIAKVDDTVWTVSTMFALAGDGKENNWDSNISNRQFYAQVKGLLDKDAILWVGKKYVQREDSYIGDFYFYDVSGHGVGFEQLNVGTGKLSAAWTRKDNGNATYKTFKDKYVIQQEADQKDDEGNALTSAGSGTGVGKVVKGKFATEEEVKVRLNVFDTRYVFPAWDGASVELGATYLRPERDKNGKFSAYTWNEDNELKDAFNLTAELTLNVLGGFNKTVLQSFSGSSADCAWSTTADIKSNSGFGGVAGFTGQGYRLLNVGLSQFTENFGMFHQFNAAYSTSNDYDSKRTLGLVVRPYYKLTKMTKVIAELGAFVEHEKYLKHDAGKADHRTHAGQKATLAYAINPDAGNFWSRPEFRFYVSYMNLTADTNVFNEKGEDTIGGAKKGHDTVFGAQVEAMW